jgi:glycosyltransferase involved in cell wall biosynthesis
METKYKQHIVIDARMISNSGIGRYIRALIPALVDSFKQVTLLGIKSHLDQYDWYSKINLIDLDIPIYSIGEQFNILSKTPVCDIFISPHYNVPLFLPQAKKLAVIIPDTNHLVFKNEFSFLKKIYASIFYRVAASKDVVFTISDFSKSEIVKYTNCSPDKIIVAKCAIDKEHFKKLDDATLSEEAANFLEKLKKSTYILFIGNIKPHKNLARALKGFESVASKYPDLKFLLVGKKDNFITSDKEIFNLVEQDNSLKNKVEFTGAVSDLYISLLYKNAEAFLFPSLYEGFGLPPLEAMFYGCPVIASKEGSLPEICGDAAYYCDAYDFNDIGEAIAAVLSNNDVRNQLISNGFKKVNEYDWSLFNKTIIDGLVR